MKKKFLLLVAVFAFLGMTAKAQDVFRKGDIVGNVQIGLGAYSNYTIGFPPTSLSVDVGAFDKLIKGENGSIGIGGYVGFGSYRHRVVEMGVEHKHSVMRMCFGARGTFHYQFVGNLDTYAGVMLGAYTNNHKDVITQNDVDVTIREVRSSSVNFASSVFAGVRYYFSDSFGVSAEAGYGLTYLSAGITFKF